MDQSTSYDGPSETFRSVFSDGVLDTTTFAAAGTMVARRRAAGRAATAASSSGTDQPMTVFSNALHQSICSRVDYYYVSDVVLSKCVRELEDMRQVGGRGLIYSHFSV